MKRAPVFVVVVVVIFGAAVGLRVRSELDQHAAVLPATNAHTSFSATPEPRDYVAIPWVADEELDHGPRRIISLAPSITELVCALGMHDRLVGRTQYCKYPPGLDNVRSVGALIDTNYELIKSLKPELILATANSKEVIKNLTELHLRCVPVPHNSLDDVYAAIVQVGDLCERPKTARALVGAIRTDMQLLHRGVTQSTMPTRRVLVVLGALPVPPQAVFVAGPGSYLESFLELSGQTNAARDALKSSHGEIPLEKLVKIDPDIILEFRDDPKPNALDDVYQSWSAVGSLKAIRQRHVQIVGGSEWLSATPRVAIELHRFIAALSKVD